MNTLIFSANNLEESRAIVKFWNSYCCGIKKFKGDSNIYTIEYNKDYEIDEYCAYDTIEEARENSPGAHNIYNNIPKFMTFPEEIRKVMIEKSESHSPIPFIKCISCDSHAGGFNWGETEEGHEFWSNIVDDEDFDLFYIHFNLKKENYESRLCIKETPFGGDSDRNPSSIRSGFNKARIAVQSLGYQKVIGRG